MAELNVICWLWGNKYSWNYVCWLKRAVEKNLTIPHRFICFSDQGSKPAGIDIRPISDPNLVGRHCFCRLRMFDPGWQERNELRGAIVSLDLDIIITGELDALFAGDSTFKILQNVNEINPCKFNASVMMLRAGEHANVWRRFSLDASLKIKSHEFPDDQGWIWHMLPDADGWKAGSESGIYGFQKPGWPKGHFDLPDGARIVSFIGKRKPSMYAHIPWVRKHWMPFA